MDKKATFILIHLLVCGILASCGASQARLDAQATEIAADIFATQTAQVPNRIPTAAPILTSIPTVTLTPSPIPTLAPTDTREPQELIAFQETNDFLGGILSEIFVMNADGSDVQNLTPNLAGSFEPSWSPDGTRIAFWSRESGNPDIWVINSDGSDPRQLTNSDIGEFCPEWSPDGTRLAYEKILFLGSFGQQNRDEPGIWIMNSDGSGAVQLVGSDGLPLTGCPSWSPDGNRIAFSEYRTSLGLGEIYLFNLDSSDLVQLTHLATDEDGIQEVTWSPDGMQLAFTFGHLATDQVDAHKQIYVANVDGSEPTQLTNIGTINSCPSWSSWSPNGSRILFHSNRDGDAEIYVMNADGSDQTRLLERSGNQSCPVFRPAP